jgi:hypothetical protein
MELQPWWNTYNKSLKKLKQNQNPFGSIPKGKELPRTPTVKRTYKTPIFSPLTKKIQTPKLVSPNYVRGALVQSKLRMAPGKPRPKRPTATVNYGSPYVKIFATKKKSRFTVVQPRYKKTRFAKNLNITTLKKTGLQIGDESQHGSVFQLKNTLNGNDHRYVLKRMNFIDDEDEYIFNNEVKVGSTPDIEQVGPRIYAYRIIKVPEKNEEYGEYIMDHVTFGKVYDIVENLDSYLQRVYGTIAFPTRARRSIVMIKLREALLKFYQITGGFHGDLHGGNIYILTDKNGEITVRFIDYGSHREFANKSIEPTLKNYFNKKTFKNINYTNLSNYYQGYGGVLEFKKGQLYTKNQGRLNMYRIPKNNV